MTRHGALRESDKKEHFTRISFDDIKVCMETMIANHEGVWTSYNRLAIDHLTQEFDSHTIKLGPKYNGAVPFHRARADQFIGKTIGKIRNERYITRGYKFGGSTSAHDESASCTTADFRYLIMRDIVSIEKVL